MAFIINAEKAFRDNIRMTKLSKQKQHPRSVRDLFCISEVHKNGIFRIEDEGRPCLYDKGYLFTDVNYTKKDPGQKKDMLEDFAAFLNSMKADFKITVASEYRDMAAYINEVFCDKHGNRYPEISEGMKMWIGEKAEQAQIHDIEKVMYLTVTTRANTYEEAKLYFSNTEDEIRTKMQILGSELFPLDGEMRLDIIRRFFYLDSDKTRLDLTNPLNDAVNDVIPFEVETFPNFMIMNGNRYVSVLFARKFDSGLNEEKVAQALTGVPYPSFFTIDYAPVRQDVLMAKLRNADINNERAIAQEIDAKNKNGQAMPGISYQKASKKVEIEGYLDQVDENSETCILADVLVVVTADSEEELALRVDSMKQNAEDVGLVLDTYNQVQVKAFNTALPIGCRLVKCMRAFFSSSLVGLQPFYAEDLIEPGGAFFGVNRTTNHLIFANRKALPSPHGIIIGHSGGGKSFLIKSTEIAQTLLSTDDDVTVIDPQNEMDMICDIFHGQFLDLTPKSVIHVNPMEIPRSILDDRTPNRQNNIEAFISANGRDINTDDSIRSAAATLAQLVAYGKTKNVDRKTIIQAYNYGQAFIDYIAQNYGGCYSDEAALAFIMDSATGIAATEFDTNYANKVMEKLEGTPMAPESYAAVESEMLKYQGVKYVWGGSTPDGFDCSGLVQYVYGTLGVKLPHSAQDMYYSTKPVSSADVQPGDLVFFTGTADTGKYVTHVGIYTGPGQMYAAGGSGVGYTNIGTQYWQSHLLGFGRVAQ